MTLDVALYAVKLEGKSGYRGWSEDLDDSPQRTLLGFTSRELAEGMPLAMLAHRPNGEVLFANDGLARLLGYTHSYDLFFKAGRNMKDFIHPDDLARARACMHEAASSEIDREHDLGFRVVTRTGDVLNVVYRARLVSTGGRGDVLYAYMVEEPTFANARR